MSLINIKNLTFSYDNSYDNIFENVSFCLDTDWKTGFIGRNGRGKTTFLNLLQNKYEFKGSIDASVNFSYFPYEVDKSLSTFEVIKGVDKGIELWQLFKEFNLLEINEGLINRPFNTLSNGEQTKILIACFFLKENNFFLIDEPTNHLDIYSRATVAKYLNSKKGFILVSHDRNFLDNCVDHIISINKENIEVAKGNLSIFFENKENRDRYEMIENEKLKRDIERLNEAKDRTAIWSDKVEETKYGKDKSGLKPDRGYIGHKAAKMMKRSKAIEKRCNDAIEEKSKLMKNIESIEELKIKPQQYYKERLLNINNLAIRYNDKIINKEVTFSINNGDRVALKGVNGSGKSSIIKLILGKEITFNGEINRGSNLKISYVSQDVSALVGTLDNFAEESRIDISLFKTILRKLDFSRIQFDKDIRDFSLGQKKKVLIAKSLSEQANLYLWDEPLNYIDLFSRIQIENLILKYKPTMVFIEHDIEFINKVANKIIDIEKL